MQAPRLQLHLKAEPFRSNIVIMDKSNNQVMKRVCNERWILAQPFLHFKIVLQLMINLTIVKAPTATRSLAASCPIQNR